MNVGKGKLVLNVVFLFEYRFDGGGGLIVQSMYLGGEAGLFEVVE